MFTVPLCFIKQWPINLGFTDSEHLGAAYRACALGRWFAILHGYDLSILHFPLSAAFHTITLHNLLLRDPCIGTNSILPLYVNT